MLAHVLLLCGKSTVQSGMLYGYVLVSGINQIYMDLQRLCILATSTIEHKEVERAIMPLLRHPGDPTKSHGQSWSSAKK